jgi:hypothetical protein
MIRSTNDTDGELGGSQQAIRLDWELYPAGRPGSGVHVEFNPFTIPRMQEAGLVRNLSAQLTRALMDHGAFFSRLMGKIRAGS